MSTTFNSIVTALFLSILAPASTAAPLDSAPSPHDGAGRTLLDEKAFSYTSMVTYRTRTGEAWQPLSGTVYAASRGEAMRLAENDAWATAKMIFGDKVIEVRITSLTEW